MTKETTLASAIPSKGNRLADQVSSTDGKTISNCDAMTVLGGNFLDFDLQAISSIRRDVGILGSTRQGCNSTDESLRYHQLNLSDLCGFHLACAQIRDGASPFVDYNVHPIVQ